MSTLVQARDSLKTAPRQQRVSGHRIGRIARRTANRVWVDFPGNPEGPIPARSVVPIAELPRPTAFSPPPEVLLVFEEERPDRPIILELLAGESRAVHSRRARVADSTPEPRRSVEAGDELVLRCGKASITLRRNGRLVLRGTRIESDSTGVNRVRGAQVRVE